MKNVIITTLLTLFFVPWVALAAADPPMYIVNDETKECSIFRGGDECVNRSIPEGWRFFDFVDFEKDPEECPNGYTKVSVETNSKPVWSLSCLLPFHSGSNYSALFFWPIIIVVIVVVIILVKRKKSKNQNT